MRIEAKDLATGEHFTGEAEALTKEGVDKLNDLRTPELGGTERDVDRYIENLKIPGGLDPRKWADARVKLKEMSKAVIEVVIDGVKTVIRIGRKLLESVFDIIKRYPNATFGLIFGAIIGALIAMIPVIGFLIGGLAEIIAPLIGAVMGGRADLRKKELKRTVQEAIAEFEHLKTTSS